MSENQTMPENHTPFSRLEGVLNQLGRPALLIPVSVESPFEQLLVSVDDPPPGPEGESKYVFQLFFSGDLLQAAFDVADAEAGEPADLDEDETAILQFVMGLPLPVPDERLLPCYQLFSVFNRILPIGAFDLNEENHVFLRYALLADRKADITIPQVVEVLELLSFFVTRMTPGIAALLSGEQTLSQVIEAAERELIDATRLPQA